MNVMPFERLVAIVVSVKSILNHFYFSLDFALDGCLQERRLLVPPNMKDFDEFTDCKSTERSGQLPLTK